MYASMRRMRAATHLSQCLRAQPRMIVNRLGTGPWRRWRRPDMRSSSHGPAARLRADNRHRRRLPGRHVRRAGALGRTDQDSTYDWFTLPRRSACPRFAASAACGCSKALPAHLHRPVHCFASCGPRVVEHADRGCGTAWPRRMRVFARRTRKSGRSRAWRRPGCRCSLFYRVGHPGGPELRDARVRQAVGGTPPCVQLHAGMS